MEEHGGAISDASELLLSWRRHVHFKQLTRSARAIDINPSYAKAYYRRGLSYLAILRPTQAVPDFKKALSIEPRNQAVREQLTATVKLIRRIEFEKVWSFSISRSCMRYLQSQAISVGETETTSSRCLTLIKEGSCLLDVSSKPDHMPLPLIPDDPKERYTPTEDFVAGMIESFKKGGKVPRRVAWEIILGVKDIVEKESSLVEIEIPSGATCDIIGDSESCSCLLSP